VAASLITDSNAAIPESDVPLSGLQTKWKAIPLGLKLEAADPTVTIIGNYAVVFDLLVPSSGDSRTISLKLTPLTLEAKLLFLVFVGDKLYRDLEVELQITDASSAFSEKQVSEITKDRSLSPLRQVDLRTTHKWTTPPGRVTLFVRAPGKAFLTGSANNTPFPDGDISIGTDKSALSGPVDSLRKAAEGFRTSCTSYLNDIDRQDLLARLDKFQPAYDWSDLPKSTDEAHETAWYGIESSGSLQQLAFRGRQLYDTLFPPKTTSREWMDGLPPGQMHISFNPVWKHKTSG